MYYLCAWSNDYTHFREINQPPAKPNRGPHATMHFSQHVMHFTFLSFMPIITIIMCHFVPSSVALQCTTSQLWPTLWCFGRTGGDARTTSILTRAGWIQSVTRWSGRWLPPPPSSPPDWNHLHSTNCRTDRPVAPIPPPPTTRSSLQLFAK